MVVVIVIIVVIIITVINVVIIIVGVMIIDLICIPIHDLYQAVLYCFSQTPVAAGKNSCKGEQNDDDKRGGKPDGDFQANG